MLKYSKGLAGKKLQFYIFKIKDNKVKPKLITVALKKKNQKL